MSGTELAESPTRVPMGKVLLAARWRISRVSASAGIVALLVAIAIPIRLVVAHQSLFADELSTYWIVTTHSLGGVMSLLYGNSRIPHAEITPPLLFVLSWLTSQIGHSPELVRAPSLIAGALTIPVVYLVGLRTVGRPAALLATALTTLSPFMIYYSAEARSYAVMMLLSMLSTLSMLRAVDTNRTCWWIAYAASSCAAFYTHYTCFFLLLAQLVWLIWAHPEARRPALLANLGAVVGVLPWSPGLINDLNSPTAKILSALSPFTVREVRIILAHWAIGFPYVEAGGLGRLPGTLALVLLGSAGLLVAIGISARARLAGLRTLLAGVDRRTGLIFLLVVSVPVGEALVSAVSTHLVGVRNLADSWPPLALSAAALIIASGTRVRFVAAGLAIGAFALGPAKMLTVRYARPDFRGVAEFITRSARPGDVVIDGSGVLSPGPLTGLDLTLHAPLRVFRAGAPEERDHPYGVFDRVTPIGVVVEEAVAAARGGRVLVVGYTRGSRTNPPVGPFPPRYGLVMSRAYRNFVGLTVNVWAERRGS